jgi:hypothetical protein
MQNQKSRLAIIHLAKKQLGLDDEAYRAILSGAGVTSAKDIETELQFNTVMGAFLHLGFLPSRHGGLNKYHSAIPGTNPAMISRRQEYYIKGLWALASRAKDEKSLQHMVKRIGKVDDISFLSRRAASALILALRDICWKAGFNPDTDIKEGNDVVVGKKSGAYAAPKATSGVLPCGNGKYRSRQSRQGLAAGAGCGS